MGISFLTKYLGTAWTLISIGTLVSLFEQTEYSDVAMKSWLLAAGGLVVGVGIIMSDKMIKAKLAEQSAPPV
jgi:FtsH-binding integral membrane protein